MADQHSSHATVLAHNKGPYVAATSYILMGLMVLSVLGRLFQREKSFSRVPKIDELLILFASVLAVIEDVIVHVAVNNGLGRPQITLNDAQFTGYSKANYASQILSIAVFALSKGSLLLFITRITPAKPILGFCRILLASIGAWAVGAMIALALQCKMPRPWDYTMGRCVNQSSLYYFNGAFNVATDFIIFAIPASIVWKVQIAPKERWKIISVFAARPIASVAIIIQLCTLHAYLQSSDQTQSNVAPSIWMQVAVNLSVITACVPALKPFITSLHCGFLDASIRRPSRQSSTPASSKSTTPLRILTSAVLKR